MEREFTGNDERVTVRCQWCERLFLMVRPLFLGERERATCPACRDEARRNMQEMTKKESEAWYGDGDMPI